MSPITSVAVVCPHEDRSGRLGAASLEYPLICGVKNAIPKVTAKHWAWLKTLSLLSQVQAQVAQKNVHRVEGRLARDPPSAVA